MREIMVRAHELAATMVGDYSARMALALRQAWAEARGDAITVERLVAIGGRLWEKHGFRRVYFNRLHEWYGLTYETYNTGNISDAWVDGARVSNSDGRRILGRLYDAKVWFDLNDGKFHGRGFVRDEDFDKIVERIKEAVRVGEARQQGRWQSAA